MTKTLLSEKSKIQQICDTLRKETLEPAKNEAARLVADAEVQATAILANAKKEAAEILEGARKKREQERAVFDTSLKQGAKQCFETLVQKVGNELFMGEVNALVDREVEDSQVVAKLIEALIKSAEGNIEVNIGKTLSVDAVNNALGKTILERIKGQSVSLGSIEGGAEVKLLDKQMTLVISDVVLKEMLSEFLRKDFRKFLFAQ